MTKQILIQPGFFLNFGEYSETNTIQNLYPSIWNKPGLRIAEVLQTCGAHGSQGLNGDAHSQDSEGTTRPRRRMGSATGSMSPASGEMMTFTQSLAAFVHLGIESVQNFPRNML